MTKVQNVLNLKIKHFVGDGKYGNNTCANLCKKFKMLLISKLQHNSELYFENTEPYSVLEDSRNMEKDLIIRIFLQNIW
ncbi:MAG: hypothetical protein U0354_17800 [Candidatus Sericytochromatia bacterium]